MNKGLGNSKYGLRNSSIKPAIVKKPQQPFNKDKWVSATKVKNYLLHDPIIDWIELNKNNFGSGGHRPPNQLELLFQKGNEFEATVIRHLRTVFPNEVKTIINSYTDLSPSKMDDTVKYMKEGVPIIVQAPLYNYENSTYGVADLVVRSDWLGRIFQNTYLPPEETSIPSPLLGKKYHYVVIDIKWTTMALCANGINLRNSDRFPAYKGQLAIYNEALGIIQGYTPQKAFVLSKAWKYEKKGQEFRGYDCFERLGHIDYDGFDTQYLKLTEKAINWIKLVREDGALWDYKKPHRDELYPNMCNQYDQQVHQIKQTIAKELDEITQVWMVGPKNRSKAHSKGIYKWSDARCTSSVLGIPGKRGIVIDKILDVNRTGTGLRPSKIKNNDWEWQTETPNDFYIDFEALNEMFLDSSMTVHNSRLQTQVIFMIGVGFKDTRTGQWSYKDFTMPTYSLMNEKKIIDEFISFIQTKTGNKPARLFHWSFAEQTMIKTANKRHNDRWSRWINNSIWIDMCAVFQSEPIVIKGAMKFDLKTITNAMHSHKLIDVSWSDVTVANGFNAMIDAVAIYQNKPTQTLMSDIVKYNEVDCKAIYSIVDYLRSHHV